MEKEYHSKLVILEKMSYESVAICESCRIHLSVNPSSIFKSFKAAICKSAAKWKKNHPGQKIAPLNIPEIVRDPWLESRGC